MNYSFIIIVNCGKIKKTDMTKEVNEIEEKNNQHLVDGGNVFGDGGCGTE